MRSERVLKPQPWLFSQRERERCALSLVCIWEMGSEKRKRVGLSYGRRSRTYEEEERVFFFFFGFWFLVFGSFENAYEGRVWVNRVVELAGFDLG
jgi:hypothetical protein